MKFKLIIAGLFLFSPFLFADEPTPGKQTAQTLELPKNMTFWAGTTQEERDAEKARRNALTPKQRSLEDQERQRQLLEEIKNPKPLSETEKETVNYWLFLPNNYKTDADKKFPLLLFLHGMGERGSDLKKVKIHGPPKLLDNPEQVKDWQFITVSPQCPDHHTWSPLQLGLLLDDLETRYAVDKDRIYVTGLSMGGFGTWRLLSLFPDRFAAGVPICGGCHPDMAKQYAEIPLWVFHGARDSVVPVKMSTEMVEAIRTVCGKQVGLTIYPDVDHNSWTETYNNPSVYRWLLEQNRSKRKGK